MNKKLFLRALKAKMKKEGHTQVSLSELMGVSQPQISKILNGDFSRPGRVVRRLCTYSGYNEYTERDLVSKKINAAVAEVWDGSEQMERQLAATIREVGMIWMERE